MLQNMIDNFKTDALPMMVFIPLLVGLSLSLLPKDKPGLVKAWALIISLFVFAISVVAAFMFDYSQSATLQFTDNGRFPWLSDFGINLSFGVDVISLYLILLTTFMMPLAILGSFSAVKERHKEFYIWLLVLQAAMIGVFAARDIIFFYICFEMTLIPMYFLIGIFGGSERRWACQKFFIFTLAGSVITFLGILYVAWFHAVNNNGVWSFDIDTLVLAAQGMSHEQQYLVLIALLVGFAVKVPLFPVHTWLPLAHTEAPTAGSVILAGVLLKLGIYGMLRFALPMTPLGMVDLAPVVAVLAIIGIIYTALICWVQDDVKKLVAYSSVSHMGFAVMGLFALTDIGIGGSVLYMINHGLSTGALFLCIGMIYERYHTRNMDEISGLGRQMPIWGAFMGFFCMASVGLPGLNGFVSEFLTVLGTFKSQENGPLGIWYAAIAGFGMILAAIYILYMLGKVVVGPLREPIKYAGAKDLNFREVMTLAPLALMCVVLGVYPTPMITPLQDNVHALSQPVKIYMEDGKKHYYDFIEDKKKALELHNEDQGGETTVSVSVKEAN